MYGYFGIGLTIAKILAYSWEGKDLTRELEGQSLELQPPVLP